MEKAKRRLPAAESKLIENTSKSIASAQAALNKCLDILDREVSLDTMKTTTNTFVEAKATRETVNSLAINVSSIGSGMGIMMRTILEAIGNSQSRIQNGMEEMIRKLLREAISSNLQTALFRLLEEEEYRRSKFKVHAIHKFLGSILVEVRTLTLKS